MCCTATIQRPQQASFGESLVRDLGFDFNRGRQDKTHHPFMTKFSWGDVRITTRYKETDLGDGLFSSIHETGHALYELGIDQKYEGTPLDTGTSAGVHESQSRLWENIVGRSAGFWEYYLPKLAAVFPEQLAGVGVEVFYKAINKSQPSLIRTDADEVTYNLHVIIRFGLELALLEGKLAVADLPEAWHARYVESLGVTRRRTIAMACCRTSTGMAGRSAGCSRATRWATSWRRNSTPPRSKAHPEIPGQIRQGKFDTLHTWLRENIYQHGSKFTANELLERVTGGPLSLTPYLEYLRTKYTAEFTACDRLTGRYVPGTGRTLAFA